MQPPGAIPTRGRPGRGAGRPPLPFRAMRSVVIVGAGAFGASLAWWLARAGAEVTLVDQFEPGDPRTTSGGESRLIRCGHGPDVDYTASARRARTLWRELEAECGEELLVECGLTWFAHREDGWEAQGDRDVRSARASRASGSRRRPARACSRATPRAASRSCCTSRRPACCARSARCGRSPARRPRTAPTVVRGRGPPGRRRGAARRRPRARGRRRRLGVRRLARAAVRRARRDPDHPPGAVLLRRRRRPGARPAVPAFVDFDQAIYGTRDIDGLGVKAAPDFDGPPLDPDAELPPPGAAGEAIARRFLARALPRARARAAARLEVLPLRALAGRALHRRAASRASLRLAARRRLRPRLQARARARRAGRRGARRRRRRCRRTSGSRGRGARQPS